MPFQSWCQQNGYSPKKPAEIVEAVEAYIAALPGAVAMCRGQNTAKTRAQAIYQEFLQTNPIPPAQPGAQQPNPALAQWKQNLVARIDLRVNTLEQQGVQQITQDVTTARLGNALVSHMVAIPSPFDFYQTMIQANYPFAKGHIVGYIDYLIEAIRNYIDNAVNHSNRRKKIRKAVIDTLQAAKQNTAYLPADKSIDSGVFNKAIPNAGDGANTLADIAEFWSKERTGTAKRQREFAEACDRVGGAPGQGFDLRRYGSTGEAEDIRLQRGFYQKEGVSFEQYKWFLDLRVPNATTSVSASDRSFWVKLKGGALDVIHDIEQEYDRNDQPPVIHKPDLGGEVGCFGVHEDCLVAFNTRMVDSIQIKNQQSGQVIPPDVKPA